MVDIESTTPHASTLPASSLCSIDISLEDTFLALSSCDPSKAMGGDGIPPMILKHAASALAEPVHHLFYLCLTKSYLPAEWRCHHITPIHKYSSISLSRHSYFYRLVRIWNALPPLDLSLSFSFSSLKLQIKQHFWNILPSHFDPSIPCSYHFICPCNKCSHSPITVNFTT